MSSFDVLIANGRVVDGRGNPWFKGDIGVLDGRIKEIGRLAKNDAKKTIDANDLIVCPGFIDIHTHSDLQLLVNPTMDSHVHQGITTDVIGNCGMSVSPVSDLYKERAQSLLELFEIVWNWNNLRDFQSILEKKGVSLNVATLIGQSAVRAAVMGMKKAAPTPEELSAMKQLVSEDMKQGAFGMSTGLFYAPGGYASTSEIIELAKVVARYGGIYTTHMRSEGDTMIESLVETLEIGKKARLPIQISHYKSTGPKNWGKIQKGFELMEQERKEGLDVTCDAYPWTAGVTPMIDYLPHWAQEGGTDETLIRLKDLTMRRKIRDNMEKGIPGEESLSKEMGWDRVMISACPSNRKYEGRTVKEIVEAENKDPYDLVFDLIIQNKSELIAIEFWGNEKDVEDVLKHHLTMISSDSAAVTPTGPLGLSKTHPRYYGNIPNLFSEYVRKKKIMSFEEGVRKATSFPAQRLGLEDRGEISEGKWADIVVLNPDEIAPVGTFGDPHHFPKGIEWVLVNGVITVEKGKHVGALAGKILIRS